MDDPKCMYQIVDENGVVYAGYNNVTNTYRNVGQARVFRDRELSRLKRRRNWRVDLGETVDPIPTLTIQRSEIVWEDFE